MTNQEQNPPQQEQPFVAAKQAGFNLEDILLNTNNEVALLYPEHNNKDYFKCVSDFISKCCLRKPYTRSPNIGIFGEVGVNTFRNAIGAHYLPHSSEYVAPPSIDVVRQWFPTIGYGEEISTKGTLRKSLLLPRWSLANGINIDYANIFWEDIIIKLKKKQREKVVPYTRFLSQLIMHKMKEGYGDDEVTLYPTQVFNKPIVFKAPKTSSKAESVSQGTKPGAQTRHKKPLTSSKQPSMSSKEAIKGGSSKAPTATGGPTSLGVTSEARANPQLSSGMLAFNLNKPIYSASFIIQSESASRNDASAASTAKADPENSAPSDFVPQQQGINEGTKNTSYDHLFAGKGASSVASPIEEETSSTIKLEDLAKLVSHVQPSFKDLDSPKYDPVIVVNDSDEDEDDEVHATKNVETEDTSVPKSSSPRSSQVQELTNQVLILQSQKYKLELEKNKAEAEADLLKDQPSFPNVEQLKELLVKSLKTKFSNILSAHDFSSSLPTKLKDLPSKFNDLTEEVKGLKNQVYNLEIKLFGELKEIIPKLEGFTKTVTSLTSQVAELKTLQWELPAEFQAVMVQAKLKTLDALPSLLILCVLSGLNSSLIPLSRGSFDVLVGMDRLSKRKFGIVCHGKVVRIPLEGDEILQVHGERTQGVVKTLMNTKVGESKLSDLVPGAMPVAKSPYRLAPLEMQELSEQLQELQDEEKEHGVHLKLELELWSKSNSLDYAAESGSGAIRFEYCLASSIGWTKSPVLWAEIRESSLIGLALVLDTTDKVGGSGYAKSVALERCNSLWEKGKRIFKKRNKKKAKKKQNQARNEKDKILSHPSEENTT
ncbi:hypothetical protein Tco_0586606 [Tanacetum coccineum]